MLDMDQWWALVKTVMNLGQLSVLSASQKDTAPRSYLFLLKLDYWIELTDY
jgi:hypothetical protein